jgi:hypothetical protein
LLALLIAMTGVGSLSLNILVPAIPSLVINNCRFFVTHRKMAGSQGSRLSVCDNNTSRNGAS